MKKTPLHAAHLALHAKMGEFAGYDMPLYYADGVMKEHEWTRSNAGIFDVSHMGQIFIEGDNVAAFWERLTPSSFTNAKENAAKYTVLTNEKGGIIDDLIITKISDKKFYAVLNAGRKDVDLGHIRKHLPRELRLTYMEDRALIALQGALAETVLHEVFRLDMSDLGYMQMREVVIDDMKIYISRLGYTGEDGFELSVPGEFAGGIWGLLLGHPGVKPVGLAARDSLRLEMGYCLYGHDIDETTTPVEADLGWVMGKSNTGFIGADVVLPQKEKGVARKRVGIRLLDKGVAREGTVLCDADGKEIGKLTSGSFSPTLKESIGQGYVLSAHTAPGSKIFADVRGRKIPAEVVSLPFLKPRTKSASAPKLQKVQ